jgi:hypothetical protein
LLLHHLLVHSALALNCFLVEQGFDAYATCFGTKMATKGVCTRETTAAAPLTSPS